MSHRTNDSIFLYQAITGTLFRIIRDIVIELTPFPEEERVETNENRANISTENMSQKSVSKDTYVDIVRNQQDMYDGQFTRIQGSGRSLKVLNI